MVVKNISESLIKFHLIWHIILLFWQMHFIFGA